LPPVLVGQVGKPAERRAAGVVDENVDAAEVLDGCCNDAVDILCLREVGRDGQHLGVRLTSDFVSGRLQMCPVPGADRDPRTLARQGEGRSLAETLARCANERHLAVQP
jgi:hypothetical protein